LEDRALELLFSFAEFFLTLLPLNLTSEVFSFLLFKVGIRPSNAPIFAKNRSKFVNTVFEIKEIPFVVNHIFFQDVAVKKLFCTPITNSFSINAKDFSNLADSVKMGYCEMGKGGEMAS
jgi:hypothetical protein